MKSVYERSLYQPAAIGAEIKPKYLEWLLLNEGISAVRKAYRKIVRIRPYCLEMHKMMIQLESLSLTSSKKWILYAHVVACKQFGRTHIGE